MNKAKRPFVVRDNPAHQRFEIDLGDGETAIADYRIDGKTIAFTHTAVPPAHEGMGVGSALVRFALEAARTRGLKVDPACAFFAAFMRRNAEDQDLLTDESRKRLGLS
ncbi:MAG: GNAT family N-acetyltransferase [Sphingomicrobium sp.]